MSMERKTGSFQFINSQLSRTYSAYAYEATVATSSNVSNHKCAHPLVIFLLFSFFMKPIVIITPELVAVIASS